MSARPKQRSRSTRPRKSGRRVLDGLRVRGDISVVNSKGQTMVELSASDSGSHMFLSGRNRKDCVILGAWDGQHPFVTLHSEKGQVCLDFDERGGRVRIRDAQSHDVWLLRLGTASVEPPPQPLAQAATDVMFKKPVRALKAKEPATA